MIIFTPTLALPLKGEGRFLFGCTNGPPLPWRLPAGRQGRGTG
jgi:hypothetical protein